MIEMKDDLDEILFNDEFYQYAALGAVQYDLLEQQVDDMMQGKIPLDEQLYNEFLDLPDRLAEHNPCNEELKLHYQRKAFELMQFWYIKHLNATKQERDAFLFRMECLVQMLPSVSLDHTEELETLRYDICSELICRFGSLKNVAKCATYAVRAVLSCFVLHSTSDERFWFAAAILLYGASECATLEWHERVFDSLPPYQYATPNSLTKSRYCHLVLEGMVITAGVYLEREQYDWAAKFTEEVLHYYNDPELGMDDAARNEARSLMRRIVEASHQPYQGTHNLEPIED